MVGTFLRVEIPKSAKYALIILMVGLTLRSGTNGEGGVRPLRKFLAVLRMVISDEIPEYFMKVV